MCVMKPYQTDICLIKYLSVANIGFMVAFFVSLFVCFPVIITIIDYNYLISLFLF